MGIWFQVEDKYWEMLNQVKEKEGEIPTSEIVQGVRLYYAAMGMWNAWVNKRTDG